MRSSGGALFGAGCIVQIRHDFRMAWHGMATEPSGRCDRLASPLLQKMVITHSLAYLLPTSHPPTTSQSASHSSHPLFPSTKSDVHITSLAGTVLILTKFIHFVSRPIKHHALANSLPFPLTHPHPHPHHNGDKSTPCFGRGLCATVRTDYRSQLKGRTLVNSDSQKDKSDQAPVEQRPTTLPMSHRNPLRPRRYLGTMLSHATQEARLGTHQGLKPPGRSHVQLSVHPRRSICRACRHGITT